MTTEILIIALFAFLFAGIIKGTIGVGLPTITISILAQFVDPRVAIAFLLFPALITNSWQIYRGGRIADSLRNLWPFGLMLIISIYISSFFAPSVPAKLLVAGIGVMVVLWTASSLIKAPPAIPARLDKPIQCGAGLIAGVIGGLTAIWSPPMLMYLHSLRLDKDDFVAYTGFLILCGTVPLAVGYLTNGLLTRELAIGSVLMIIPTLVGFSVGEKMRSRLDAKQFQKMVLMVFCLMGLNLIRRAFVQ